MARFEVNSFVARVNQKIAGLGDDNFIKLFPQSGAETVDSQLAVFLVHS